MNRYNWKRQRSIFNASHVTNPDGMKYWNAQTYRAGINQGGLDIAFMGDDLVVGRKSSTLSNSGRFLPIYNMSFPMVFRRKIQSYYNPRNVIGGVGYKGLLGYGTEPTWHDPNQGSCIEGVTSTNIYTARPTRPTMDGRNTSALGGSCIYLDVTASPATITITCDNVDTGSTIPNSLPFATGMELVYKNVATAATTAGRDASFVLSSSGNLGTLSCTHYYNTIHDTSGARVGMYHQDFDGEGSQDIWEVGLASNSSDSYTFTVTVAASFGKKLFPEGIIHYNGDKWCGVRTWVHGEPNFYTSIPTNYGAISQILGRITDTPNTSYPAAYLGSNTSGFDSTFGPDFWGSSNNPVYADNQIELLDNKQLGAFVFCEQSSYLNQIDPVLMIRAYTRILEGELDINDNAQEGLNSIDPKPSVIIVIPYAPLKSVDDDALTYSYQDYADALKALPATYDNVVILDLWELSGSDVTDSGANAFIAYSNGYCTDGIRPNERGTEWMAAELFKLFAM